MNCGTVGTSEHSLQEFCHRKRQIMKITAGESFRLEIPLSREELLRKYYNSSDITRIRTDQGITGYGFQMVDVDAVS